MELAERFINESLAIHWQVDDTEESFERLICHLDLKTNFKPYFEESIKRLQLDSEKYKEGVIVADIGAGVCWTSAILAKHPNVKHVYAVDPSDERLKHARYVLKHFKVAEGKVTLVKGTFTDPKVPEKVNLLLLCGALHHCYDEDIPKLFSNIRSLLAKGGIVLIASEHYVTTLWLIARFLSCVKNFKNRRKMNFSITNLRAPDSFSGEHWRTRKELLHIFHTHGFKTRLFTHNGDLCKDKPHIYQRMGWKYYYAFLNKV